MEEEKIHTFWEEEWSEVAGRGREVGILENVPES